MGSAIWAALLLNNPCFNAVEMENMAALQNYIGSAIEAD